MAHYHLPGLAGDGRGMPGLLGQLLAAGDVMDWEEGNGLPSRCAPPMKLLAGEWPIVIVLWEGAGERPSEGEKKEIIIIIIFLFITKLSHNLG